MSSSAGNASGGGIGVFGLLFVLFVALKLTHQIAWSWLWVTAPLWGGVALFAGGFGVFLVVVALVAAFTGKKRFKR